MTAARAGTLPALAEVFREHGYAGASLSLLGAASGLGKGSLYNLFPGGKAEMATCVLAEIDGWFETNVFVPLRSTEPAGRAVSEMFDSVERYFRSGRRVCLVGVLALGTDRDQFAEAVRAYFARWIAALAEALTRHGHPRWASVALAEEAVAQIQGAIVLSRALDDADIFARAVAAMRDRTVRVAA